MRCGVSAVQRIYVKSEIRFRLFLRRRRRRRHDAKRLVDSRTQPFTVRRRSDDRSSPLAYVSIYVRPHRLLPAGGRRGLLRS